MIFHRGVGLEFELLGQPRQDETKSLVQTIRLSRSSDQMCLPNKSSGTAIWKDLCCPSVAINLFHSTEAEVWNSSLYDKLSGWSPTAC